jgi:hypothetical protein
MMSEVGTEPLPALLADVALSPSISTGHIFIAHSLMDGLPEFSQKINTASGPLAVRRSKVARNFRDSIVKANSGGAETLAWLRDASKTMTQNLNNDCENVGNDEND